MPIPGFAGSLPEGLEDLWRELGLCAYADGLLWVVDPGDFASSVHEWFGPDSGTLVIARSAFADLFMWRESRMVVLDPRSGRVTELPMPVSVFFSFALSRSNYRDALCNREHFDIALPRLGKLSASECYGYFPALALGGSGEPDTIQRVGLFEHLSLLRQLTS